MYGSPTNRMQAVSVSTRGTRGSAWAFVVDYGRELGLAVAGLCGVIALLLAAGGEDTRVSARHETFDSGLNTSLRPMYRVQVGHVPEELMLLARGGHVVTWRHEREFVQGVTIFEDENVICVRQDPGSGVYVAGFSHGEVVLWSLEDPDRRQIIKAFDGEMVVETLFHAERDMIVAATTDGRITYGPVDVPPAEWTVRQLSSSVGAMSLHGDQLYALTHHGALYAIDIVADNELWRVQAHAEPSTSLTISRDGRHAATAAMGGVVRLWDLEHRTMSAEAVVEGMQALALAFSPDGTRLATGGFDKQVRFWNVPDLAEAGGGPFHNGSIRSLDYSPDGKSLFSGSLDGSVYKWNISENRVTRSVCIPFGGNQTIRDLRDHPDMSRYGSRRVSRQSLQRTNPTKA